MEKTKKVEKSEIPIFLLTPPITLSSLACRYLDRGDWAERGMNLMTR